MHAARSLRIRKPLTGSSEQGRSSLQIASARAPQAAGDSVSPRPPDPDAPPPPGMAASGLLRCCSRSPARDPEDDVFGKKWVAVYDATGTGLRSGPGSPPWRWKS